MFIRVYLKLVCEPAGNFPKFQVQSISSEGNVPVIYIAALDLDLLERISLLICFRYMTGYEITAFRTVTRCFR